MSPYSHEMGVGEPVGGTQGAGDGETAAPDTISPTPSPSPSITPSASPPAPLEEYQNPPPMLHNTSTDCLPIDHNLPHLLRKVSGNVDLNTIRDIKLQVISREMSLQRLALFIPNLKELNLDGSCLGSLRDLGCGLSSLHVLRVSRCGLESLDGTFGLSSLRELYASKNQVEDIGPCSCLLNIRTIDLCKNAIQDINSLEYLKMCPHLMDLSLSECPAANKPQYQHKIRFFLPNLSTLDGIPMAQDGGASGHGNNYNSNVLSRSEDQQEIDLPQHYPPHTFSGDSSGEEMATLPLLSESCKEPSAPKIRPATTGSVNKSTRALSEHKKLRPASSSAVKEDGDQCDSPSALTSGTVVCGNLIMALRNRRKRTDAWTDDDGQSNQQETLSKSGIKLKTEEKSDKAQEQTGMDAPNDSNISSKAKRRYSSKLLDAFTTSDFSSSAIPHQEVGSGSHFESEQKADGAKEDRNTTDILEESKKWREMFTEYRSQNRIRWEKEKDDVIDDTAATYTNSKKCSNTTPCETKYEKPSSVEKKFQGKSPVCCPHLFSRQKSSFNADSSSGLPTENAKTSGRNAKKRDH